MLRELQGSATGSHILNRGEPPVLVGLLSLQNVFPIDRGARESVSERVLYRTQVLVGLLSPTHLEIDAAVKSHQRVYYRGGFSLLCGHVRC